jgi:hypothetical protein
MMTPARRTVLDVMWVVVGALAYLTLVVAVVAVLDSSCGGPR